METNKIINWKLFYKQSSEKQYFFTLSKQGFRFNKGYFKGHLLQDLYDINKEQLKDYLENVYRDERSTSHTRMVIIEIMEEIFKKKINKKP